MALQTGTDLVIAYRKESTFGTLATNDASAKKLRRVKFGIGMKKDAIRSTEIRTDGQRAASRHAMRKVDGPIEGELSLGTYAAFLGSALRRDFAAVSALSALTNVTATATAPQFVRATGSWITDGLRVGMTIRMSGWTTTGVPNNGINYTIIALTATQITVAETVAAKAAGDSVIVTIPGKTTYTPGTGRTDDAYSFEQWAASITQSLRYVGNKVGSVDIMVPPNDKAMITIGFVGQDRVSPVPTAQYFTAAVAASSNQMATGLIATIWINGVAQGYLTDLKLSIKTNPDTVSVVGDDITPNVFLGSVEVEGSFSALWSAGTLDGFFDLETSVPVVIQLRDTAAAATDFLNLTLPAVKLVGGDLPDAEKAIIQNFSFTASVGDGTSGYEATTLFAQDSLA